MRINIKELVRLKEGGPLRLKKTEKTDRRKF
jgi:hypothetical protein